jgi:hypothetical protein
VGTTMDGGQKHLTFQRGDRVRLTNRAANMAMKGYAKLRRKQFHDWHARRGTVMFKPTVGGSCVVIKWDDAKWGDSWPKNAIEKDE